MSTILEFAPVGEHLVLGLLMIHSKTLDGKDRMCPLAHVVELHAGFQPRMDKFHQMPYKEEWMVSSNIIFHDVVANA